MLELEQVQMYFDLFIFAERGIKYCFKYLIQRYMNDNWLTNPELRNNLLHLILKNIFNFRYRPSELPGNLV